MKWVDIDGIQLNVCDQGQGPVLLLVHGFPLDHTMWRGQIEDLAREFRVIAPDLRGFGRSDVTEGVVSMERFADDLAALLDALDARGEVAFCGLSMGGYVAWQFWRRHRSRLSHLVLCDTRAAPDTPEAAQARLESADRVLAEGVGFLADAMVGKLFADPTRRERPELVEAMRKVMLGTPAAGAAAALRGMAARQDATGWLSEIDVPALVLCGRYDAISPVDEMRGMAQRIPEARFVEIPDAGHMAPLENPEAVNRAIREILEK